MDNKDVTSSTAAEVGSAADSFGKIGNPLTHRPKSIEEALIVAAAWLFLLAIFTLVLGDFGPAGLLRKILGFDGEPMDIARCFVLLGAMCALAQVAWSRLARIDSRSLRLAITSFLVLATFSIWPAIDLRFSAGSSESDDSEEVTLSKKSILDLDRSAVRPLNNYGNNEENINEVSGTYIWGEASYSVVRNGKDHIATEFKYVCLHARVRHAFIFSVSSKPWAELTHDPDKNRHCRIVPGT